MRDIPRFVRMLESGQFDAKSLATTVVPIERMLALKDITPQNTPAAEYAAKRSLQAESGVGGFPFVGTPDKVAREFADIGRAGVRGIAVSFVNYVEEVPYFCAEVLPRLQRMGLRAK